jgi:uncharacterized Zn finger protein (UPF0148 family)
MKNPDCPKCGKILDTFADDYWCPRCRKKYTKSELVSNKQVSNEENVGMNNEEKELLACKQAILTNKRLYLVREQAEYGGLWFQTGKEVSFEERKTKKEKEVIEFKDIVEAYTSNSIVPKVVLRLSNNSTKEFSAGDTRSGFDKATSLFMGTSYWLSNTQKGMQISCDRWVNRINSTRMAKEKIQIILDFSSLKDALSKGGIVMTAYKCPICNGTLDLPEAGKVLICKYCGTPIKPIDIFEKVKSLIQ